MNVNCPNCGKSLRYSEEVAGRRGQCPKCAFKFQIPAANLPQLNTATTSPPPPPKSSPPPLPVAEILPTAELVEVLFEDEYFTLLSDGSATFRVKSVQDAKLAIKVLKLLKKQLRVSLREVNAQLREIRHQYTDHTRRRGSMIRGGGGIGQFIRIVQTISRDTMRHLLAEHVDPLHAQKQYIDRLLTSIDQHIVRLEGIILRLT